MRIVLCITQLMGTKQEEIAWHGHLLVARHPPNWVAHRRGHSF